MFRRHLPQCNRVRLPEEMQIIELPYRKCVAHAWHLHPHTFPCTAYPFIPSHAIYPNIDTFTCYPPPTHTLSCYPYILHWFTLRFPSSDGRRVRRGCGKCWGCPRHWCGGHSRHLWRGIPRLRELYCMYKPYMENFVSTEVYKLCLDLKLKGDNNNYYCESVIIVIIVRVSIYSKLKTATAKPL